MIGTIRLKNALIIAAAIVVTAIFCVGGICIAAHAVETANPISEYTVVVDAGHGGIDGGVVGKTGVKESDINLKMAKILKKKLEGRGFGVVMTREDENALSNIKRLDMQARKDIIVKAAPIAVISLHVNRFSDSSRRGAQVFYDDTGIGREFAEIMQKAINENINAKYSGRDNYEAIGGDLFITKCVKAPSIIIECGFISNAEDEKLLLSLQYCEDICENISKVLSESVTV